MSEGELPNNTNSPTVVVASAMSEGAASARSDNIVKEAVRAPRSRTRTVSSSEGNTVENAISMSSLMSGGASEYEEDRFWQKRKRSSSNAGTASQSDSDTNNDDVCRPGTSQTRGTSRPKRGRGRPPKASDYVTITKAKREAVTVKLTEKYMEVENKVAGLVQQLRQHRVNLSPNRNSGGSQALESEPQSVAQLSRRVGVGIDIIQTVAKKSGHLKGTYQSALNAAADAIKEAVSLLQERCISEETKLLQISNDRLRSDLANIRKEVAERQTVTPPLPNNPQEGTEKLECSIMRKVIDALEVTGRLLPEQILRPSLKADKHITATSQTSPFIDQSAWPPLTASKPIQKKGEESEDYSGKNGVTASFPSTEKQPKKKKKKKKSTLRRDTEVCAAVEPLLASSHTPATALQKSSLQDDKWTLVEKKKSKNSKKAGATAPGPQVGKRVPKLRVPLSTAVVIALNPGAEERGISYSSVLASAREKIDLIALGIPPVRFKTSATGARILEVPGATSGDKADILAQKLRDLFDPDSIKVSRPVKCAEMLVSGLDDSINSGDVISAVVNAGGCSADSVRCGEFRKDHRGCGLVWVRCPVATAKKLAQKGVLQVGWVAARLTVCEPKPLRCFRCLEVGHVRAQCASEIDRSEVCYRCGQLGHKAGQCLATKLCCAICAAAKRPAEHKLGSQSCRALELKKKQAVNSQTAQSQPRQTSQSTLPVPEVITNP